MKQLYLIGILVAVILMLLFGLSKLNQTSNLSDTVPEDTPSLETEEEFEKDVDEELELDSLLQEAITPTTTMEQATTEGNITVILKTNKGDVTVELFTKDMPITAGNFLKLAKEGYYDGIKFHRVIPNFMIQGGDPLTKDDSMKARWGTGGPGYAIEDEFVPGFSNTRGTLSMANSGPNTGGSQFFINTAENTNLDYNKDPLTSKHPVFGRVISGMEVVDAISTVARNERDVPDEAVVITQVVLQ